MHLLSLPPEILELVASELPWSSLAALSQTCKTIHQVTAQLILRDGYLCSADGWYIHEDSQPVKGLSSRLQGVKHLTVASPDPHFTVSTTDKGRCTSCLTQANETAPGKRRNGSYKAKPLSATIGWQLDMLKPKTLKSFSWTLGVCPPRCVFHELALDQPSLQELTLITCYRRYGIRCQWRDLRLDVFENLTRLSWTGVTQGQLSVLAAAFKKVGQQLVHLHLDFVATTTGVYTVDLGGDDDTIGEVDTDSLFGRLIVSLVGRSETGIVFPSLKSLSLVNTVLGPRAGVMCKAFNTKALESLKLKHCLSVCIFLRALEKELEQDPTPAPLKSLELHLIPAAPMEEDVRIELAALMRRWVNLEDFAEYIVAKPSPPGGYGIPFNGDPSRTEGRYPMAIRCSCTPGLRRYVFHPGWRWYFREDKSEPPPVPVLGPTERAFHSKPVMNPLSHLRLEFLGYAASPLYMKLFLQHCILTEALSELVVLHVRQYYENKPRFFSHAFGHDPAGLPKISNAVSGKKDHATWEETPVRERLTPECYEFLTWIFNSAKFPKLKLVALGDFGAIEPNNRLLVCRSENPIDDPPLAKVKYEPVTDHTLPGWHVDYYNKPQRSWRLVKSGDQDIVSVIDEYIDSLVVGPDYSRPYLRDTGATLTSNFWKKKLGVVFARESEQMSRRPKRKVPA